MSLIKRQTSFEGMWSSLASRYTAEPLSAENLNQEAHARADTSVEIRHESRNPSSEKPQSKTNGSQGRYNTF